MLNINLINFYEELNNVQWIKNKFSVIQKNDYTISLFFSNKAWKHMDNENSRPYKRFKHLIEKYDLDYDFISHCNIEVWTE